MSIEKDTAAIEALLMSCGMDSSDKVDVVLPKPTRTKPSKILKYIKFDDTMSKEDKYSLVLKEVLNGFEVDFLMNAKAAGWLDITYSRQYKKGNGSLSEGGPVFYIYDNDDKKRYGEVNSRFPIFNLLTDLRIIFNKLNDKKQAP